MFSSQLSKHLRDCEREITNKESAHAQRTDNNVKHFIISRPTSKPSGKKTLRHAAKAKDGKTSVSESSTKKCTIGKPSTVAKPHSIGNARASMLVPLKSHDSEENIIHKEVIENTGATVEITVKTKGNEHTHKRTRSRSRVRNRLPRSNVVSSGINGDETVDIGLSSARMCPRYPNETDLNHRPWCELLKSRETAFAGRLNHGVLGDTKGVNSKHVTSCAGNPRTTDLNQSDGPSAEFCEIRCVNERDDGGRTKRVDSIQKEGASVATITSQVPKKVLDSPHSVGRCDTAQYPKEINTVFTGFDPLRILNFLVRELQGIVSKHSGDGGSMKRIVRDMEETLKRLPDRYKCVSCQQSATSQSPPTKPYESSQTAPGQDAPDVVALQQTSRLLEEHCSQLSKDKKKLEVELAEKSKKLEAYESKGKENLQRNSKMAEELVQMKKKHDEQMEMLTNLSKVTFQLKNENKVIVPLRETQAKLNSRLEEMNQKVENMQTELQLVKLERDKFRLLLEDKTKDVETLKQLVKNVQSIVSEQLTNLKKLVQHKNAKDQLDNVIRAVSECSLKVTGNNEVALSCGDMQSLERAAIRPRCSSPTSSVVSSSLAVSPSWQMISKISNIPDNDNDTNKASPLVILAHGSDSNAEECSLDETVRFDDSKELQPEDHRLFCSLQSIQDLTVSMQCGPQNISDAVPMQVQNNTVHVGLTQSSEPEHRKDEEKLNELCKVFQDLGKNFLLQLNPPQPYQKHVTDADNSSDWTDYSDNA